MGKSKRRVKQHEPGWQPVPGVTLRHTLRGHKGVVFRIAWSPDGNWLASPSLDKTIRIWDSISGTVFRTLRGHTDSVIGVAWSPDGRRLASAWSDKTVRLWDTGTDQSLRTLRGHTDSVIGVAWSPDGRRLASTSADKTVRLWDADTGELIQTLEGHSGFVEHVVWSPDGRILASASVDCTVRLWDAGTGNSIQTLEGDSAWVYSVAWLPGNGTWRLASAGEDRTIRIWDTKTGRTTNVLEGHTQRVVCVAFSWDGQLLASKGGAGDDTIRLWRCDTWQPVAIIPEQASNNSLPSVAFHPYEPVLATVGSDADAKLSHDDVENKRDTLIHIWQLDLATLLGEAEPSPVAKETVYHTTAKIVLVGDAGVGKTGLGWRLAHGEFKEHASTHGQQFWVLDQLSDRRKDGTQCEAVLWDLAGQPDYRLIHALFLDDADLALVVFDPTHSRDPLGGVEYWLQQLPPRCPKILVAARVDRGSPTLTHAELDQFCRQRGITGGFVETSALQGLGLEELLRCMKEQIHWDAKTATTTTATFKRIKDFVLELKEDRAGRQILFTPDELRQRLETSDEARPFTEPEMMTAVERLASHGYVRVLKTSDGQQRILLVPELLNNLAASFILEARRNPKGLGALEEQRVLDGGYRFPELDNLSKPDHDLLLDATTVAFLENRLTYRCFREILGETRLLVFPELMNLKKPQTEDEPTVDDVAYTVTGASENTYASLVVLLGYTNAFLRTDQWHNQARYEFQDGLVCGFRRTDDRDGEVDFVLFYGPTVGQPVRSLFQGLFETFLARKNLTVLRFAPLVCGQCGERFDRSVMRERLRAGKNFAFCNECGNRLSLPPADEPVRLTQGLRSRVQRQRESAEQRVVFEQAVFQLNSFVEGQGLARPRCFLSYAWGDQVDAWRDPRVERWVARLDEDLQKAGLDVLLDQRSNVAVGLSIQRFVDQIAACDRILVVGTPLYLKKYENRQSETGSVVAAAMDLISDRMLGTEEQKGTVLPLLLSGNERVSLPPSLRRRVYADFRDETAYFATAFDLIVSLYGIPFGHPAVAEWRRPLRGDEILRRAEPDGREFSDEQLRAALPQIGRDAREAAFRAGRPVIVLKDERPVWIYPDGRESPVGPTS
jgi:WD40 repeat protein/GTPase SAR1 family protein